jgi:hypothetical protein
MQIIGIYCVRICRDKAWVEKAFEHVAGLPPKEPKVSKPRTKKLED